MSQGATQTANEASGVPGGTAEKPSEVPAKGWLQIAKRGWAEAKVDQVPLLAAGLAFYAFLAIFPALIACVLLYSLIADPSTIATQVDSLGGAVPDAVRDAIKTQLTTQAGKSGALGWSSALTILLALWSASGGVSNLMSAVNTAYDEEETRGFLKKRGIALALTLGTIVFVIIILALVAVAPALLQSSIFQSGVVKFLLQVARWVLLAAFITAALAIVYRVAPDRDAPKVRWVSVGAGIATVLWLVASLGFSIYVSNFSSYDKTYGALAGIVVLLFWLWITSYAILLGAEINAESEQQTIADTTKGAPQPIGKRDAVKADSLPTEDGQDANGQKSRKKH
jgi:membrane protein